MMNYDDMFYELDTIEKVEIKYNCCNDTNNYKFGLLMLSSDIAIGSCGVNLLERLYLPS